MLHGLLLLLKEWVTGGEEAGIGVGANRASEQQYEGLGFVDFVVDPAAGLLHSERAPLVLGQESLLRHLLEDVLGKEHMTVLIHVVLVLLRILYFLGEVWHCSLFSLSVNLFFEFIYNIEIFKLL